MSRAARSRLATALTIVLVVVLIGAGLLVRGSSGEPAAPQPVAATAAAPAAAPEPAAALTVSGDDEIGEELDDD